MVKRNAPENIRVIMIENARPSAEYFLLMSLSAAIATLGLIIDSAPAIIGAMIIAPLMAPIMGLAYGIANLETRIIAMSVVCITLGVALVVSVGAILTVFAGSRLAGYEILTRTEPTLIDFGIALAAGCAAAFAHSRASIQNSIAGVAIAVSLVPPLAVTGIGLTFGADATDVGGFMISDLGVSTDETDISYGSLLLFLTNLVGILAVAVFVFLGQGYGSLRRSTLGLLALAVAIWALARPLEREFHEFYVGNRVVALLGKIQMESGSQQYLQVESVNADIRNGTVYVDASILATGPFFLNTQRDLDEFRNQISDEIGEPVELSVHVIPVDVLRFQSSSETESDK